MNKIKILIFYFAFFSFVGCKTKQKNTYVEKVKDSTVRNIILESNNTLEISTLCDTLGNAKEFSQEISNGVNTTKVSIKDNKLTIDVRNDSIVYVDKEVIKEVTNIQTITVYKVPKWSWWYMIIVTFLALLGWKVWRLF